MTIAKLAVEKMSETQLIKALQREIDNQLVFLSGDDLADMHFLCDYVWEGMSKSELVESAKTIAADKLADLGGDDAIDAFGIFS